MRTEKQDTITYHNQLVDNPLPTSSCFQIVKGKYAGGNNKDAKADNGGERGHIFLDLPAENHIPNGGDQLQNSAGPGAKQRIV